MDALDQKLAECLDGEADAKSWRELRRRLRERPDRIPDTLMLLREQQALGHILSAKDDNAFVDDVLRDLRDDAVRFVSRVEQDVRRTARSPWRRRWPALAAAAGFLAAAGLALLLSNRHASTSAVWIAVAAEGAVHDETGRAIGTGARLEPGTALALGPDGRLTLVAGDGTRATAKSGTRMRLADEGDPEQLFLISGAVYCRRETSTTRRASFTVRTANGLRIETVGTRFEVRASAKQSDVLLESGRLVLRGGEQVAALNQAPQAIVFRADGFSEPSPVPLHSIAVWKFERIPLREGPVLFEDNFEGDLSRWTVYRFSETYAGLAISESMPAPAVSEVSRVKPAGRSARASVLSIRLPDRSTTHLLMEPQVQAAGRGYREEYDVRLLRHGTQIEHFMFISHQPATFMPVDPADAADGIQAPQDGRWYRMRKDYRWALDEQNQIFLDLKSYVNGRLYSDQRIYPHLFHFGFAIRSGEVQVDNYVLRALIPDERSAP